MVRLLDERDLEDITTELVLHESGISRSSLYHHFADFGELIEAAEVIRFTRFVDYSIRTITEGILGADTREKLAQALRIVTRATQPASRGSIRAQRVTLLGHASRNPRFAQRLGIEQERMTEALADLIREGQGRGLMNTRLDARAVAVLLQAYTIGKIVDDITPNHMSDDAWIALIDELLDNVLLAD